MKIAMAQINTAMGDLRGNEKKIRSLLTKASTMVCDLVIFPELALVGYPPKDEILQHGFFEEAFDIVEQLAKDHADISFILGSAEKNHNVAYVISGGKIKAICRKNLLPNYDIFDERRYFRPGSEPVVVEIANQKIGVTICEDIWAEEIPIYNNDPIKLLKGKPLDFVVNISASPFEPNKLEKRHRIVARCAQKLEHALVYVNLVGGNDDIIFDGGSFAVNSKGEVIAQAEIFQEELKCFEWSDKSFTMKAPANEIETISKALTIGVRDFVRKCRFKDVVLGLSGGVDSALVLLLAVEALGKEHVHPVFMPSKFTSQDSREDVAHMIQKIGMPIEIIPITDIFESFSQVWKSSLQQDAKSLTLENIQSRIRGNLLMSFSGERNALVLNTGNKSEIATGYCTLYGDTIGGVAVLGDLYKHEVYTLTRHLNRKYEAVPERVLTRAPSAELKENQKDSDSLPPYSIVDAVVQCYVERAMSVDEIMSVKWGFDGSIFTRKTVESIISLIHKNEFKRKQMPPILRVSEKAFGVGRRMPIASQNYEV